MQSWKVAFIRTSHFSAHKVFYVTRAVTNLGEMKNFKNCRLGRSIDHNNIFSFPRLSYDCFQLSYDCFQVWKSFWLFWLLLKYIRCTEIKCKWTCTFFDTWIFLGIFFGRPYRDTGLQNALAATLEYEKE